MTLRESPNMWFVSHSGDGLIIDNVSNPMDDKRVKDNDAFYRDFNTAIECLRVVVKNKPHGVDDSAVLKRVGKVMEEIFTVRI